MRWIKQWAMFDCPYQVCLAAAPRALLPHVYDLGGRARVLYHGGTWRRERRVCFGHFTPAIHD